MGGEEAERDVRFVRARVSGIGRRVGELGQSASFALPRVECRSLRARLSLLALFQRMRSSKALLLPLSPRKRPPRRASLVPPRRAPLLSPPRRPVLAPPLSILAFFLLAPITSPLP